MRVRFFAFIRDYTGCAEADIPYEVLAAGAKGRGSPPVTVGALARLLCDLYGKKLKNIIFPDESNSDKKSGAEGKEKFGPEIIFLINGRHVAHLGGTLAPLSPDDRVDVFPVVAGG